jgi:pimeloyl-ACP methyl ester carboxylesterase
MSPTLTSTDGAEIHWSTEGSGPPLVLVDPILVDRALSPNASLADELSETFSVIRYDRRGKGDSATSLAPTPDSEVDDLRAVIDAVSPTEPPAVFGLSSGGSLALLAASRGVPMRALVVMEPPSSRRRPPSRRGDRPTRSGRCSPTRECRPRSSTRWGR